MLLGIMGTTTEREDNCMKKILGTYENGNYTVMLLSDGTKIRFNNKATMKVDFPESIDMKISNLCNMGCPMCHEQSVPDGELANLSHPLLDSLHPYTELALGGGNVLEHPDLFPFLSKMKDQKVICNMTLHLVHLNPSSNQDGKTSLRIVCRDA